MNVRELSPLSSTMICLGVKLGARILWHSIFRMSWRSLAVPAVYEKVIRRDKLIFSRTGSVTETSSPAEIKDDTGLSRFARVICSRAGGFCIYNVLPLPLVILGA